MEYNYIIRDKYSGEYYWKYYPSAHLEYLPMLEIDDRTDNIESIMNRARRTLKNQDDSNSECFDLITFNLIAEPKTLSEDMAGYLELWNLIKDYFKIDYESILALESLAGTTLVDRINPRDVETKIEWHIEFWGTERYELKKI